MMVSRASFAGFVQFYSDETSIKLKSKKMIAYPDLAVLPNVSLCWPDWLVYNGHIVVRFLLASNLESLECLLADDITPIHWLSSGSTV